MKCSYLQQSIWEGIWENYVQQSELEQWKHAGYLHSRQFNNVKHFENLVDINKHPEGSELERDDRFEFVFVYGARKYSRFILLQVVVQFTKHHLLKTLFFSCVCLFPLVIDWLTIRMSLYYWAFNSVPLVCVFLT